MPLPPPPIVPSCTFEKERKINNLLSKIHLLGIFKSLYWFCQTNLYRLLIYFQNNLDIGLNFAEIFKFKAIWWLLQKHAVSTDILRECGQLHSACSPKTTNFHTSFSANTLSENLLEDLHHSVYVVFGEISFYYELGQGLHFHSVYLGRDPSKSETIFSSTAFCTL
jgi:hypothetical protein